MSLLELQHVGYRVGDTPILQDVNLKIDKQEWVTIAGPSGSGKSTLVRIIASLLSKTSGELRFAGQPIESYDPIAYRRRVSYAFQQPTLFGETVADNLAFPYQIRQEPFDQQRAITALEYVGLGEGDLTKHVTDLSGGQRQRIALLRNVMIYPEVLILDEVTAGLDADNKAFVWNMIQHFNQDDHLTIIAITHDQSEIESAKRLVTIENGQIVGGAQ
ncbi:ABC transporter ATP-binding protein [Levilactobacillus brevis]|uniref:Spermidine/putrescine ABC transporter ATP-binding protein n=1 Tax=Levilactobacillus brevis TaxID=1580 RepID=A0AAJ5FNC3_LEVBR|nr:ATP-binding cassette domain-containing protein [Levilactobacillus brevis]ARN89302.1 spermidine/putrescine ABC transporter ATP-binding protein [Levilactobacillus brevis]ARN96882.1 spermidine/putrescine ABC transporter ATP-binding protein [Levilactobacillus brevis]AWP47408.1 spermidine/putrescine ABC transporter ATP-binding protein [Levilactobacillus brevis]MCT3567299.1 ATP-binding cassette domain-containing protein [Levilactobacillus brevis]RAY08541.1 ATP-binding cassette domain-containing p